MSEMVERVAEAIRDRTGWDEDPNGAGMEMARRCARAAIEAMREPTQAQYDALCATDKTWRELDSGAVWKTYIDAALKD